MRAVKFENSLSFAKKLDAKDTLKKDRRNFFLPQKIEKEIIYFCGNSLGLQPKTVRASVEQELIDWEKLAVDGHFKAKNPWFYYHHFFSKQISKLVGAKPSEVVVMNTLTTNLHLLFISFYRPTKGRFKILIESPTFPSDYYAVESQVKFHGFNPKDAIIELCPRKNENTLRTEDILEAIKKNKKEIALIWFSGVNYYTGQFFDLKKITEAGHRAGAAVGFDLAHAIGNVPMRLHNWGVDFAVWCSYKYLNSGPGGPGGIFVNEKHGNNFNLPRFAGWWGHDEQTRFLMQKNFKPMKGAAGWQLSNAQVLSMAAHKASLEIFDEVGMNALRRKSEMLTGYLEFLIEEINKKIEDRKKKIEIITPKILAERGCQISLLLKNNGRKIFEKLTKTGVVSDWREPDVIRVAPVPLYNSFVEVWKFAQILEQSIYL